MSVQSVLVCRFAGLLNPVWEVSNGEQLERGYNKKGLENALLQCHRIMGTFRGSEETLAHIKRVEESLSRLIVETD